MSADVAAAIDRLLTERSCEAVAAFVYGSVAAGRAGPASDVDTFVLLARPLSDGAARELRTSFVDLQRRLGYVPDTDYPVELFTVEQVHTALTGAVVERAVEQSRSVEKLGTALAESDEVEILRALLGVRLTVRHSPRLDELTALAGQVLTRRLGTASPQLHERARRVLGVRQPHSTHAGGTHNGHG
ncbi:nucleotidyltransferase domain-containing protein [Streptomyces sp. NPDC016469]|uniref:nucleotidyltransferase domain-containing protein n=1 Tax=Streptomyces sp. NPDC016469 TaxID=3157191 RepID=UPI0033F74C24